ncbi:MAG: hypothetical protein HY321_16075 [Armatimonadetes bacterium]|nr:hypothetical protein [Armatimonadota bacterium]
MCFQCQALTWAASALLMTQLGAWPAPSSGAGAADAPPDIIPTPRQMTLTRARFDLAREGNPTAVIVLGDAPTRQSEIAAEEINDALRSSCGVALPVKQVGALAVAEREAASLILIGGPGENALLTQQLGGAIEAEAEPETGRKLGSPTHIASNPRLVRVSAHDPGPQGYVIQFAADGKRRLALLAGSDPLGTLYAGVTFRRLIRGEAGRAHAVEAVIRDWPDAKWRHTWTVALRSGLKAAQSDPEKGLEAAKREIDWLVRHKINVFFSYHAGKARHAQAGEGLQPWYREALHYAFERGLWGFTFGEGILAPDQEEWPCATPRDNQRWCWSRDELLDAAYEKNVKEIAANVPEDPGIGGLFICLHMPDTGNMGWQQRCDQCRQRYGNDQGAAQAHLFNRFYQAARRQIPNSKLVLVPRPYATWDLDAPKNGILRERITKIARSIPADSFLVHTHGDREATRSWVEAVGDRGLMHWLNLRGLGFARAKTYYFEGREDLFQYPASGNALEILAAVEYMWNTSAPGSTEIRRDRERPYQLVRMSDEGDTPADVGKQPAQFAHERVDGVPYWEWFLLPAERKLGPGGMAFLARAARYLYGEAAAPSLLRAHLAREAGIMGVDQLFRTSPPLLHGWPYVPVTTEGMAALAPVLDAGVEALEEMVRQGTPVAPGYQGVASPAAVLSLNLASSRCRVWVPLLKAREAADANEWGLVGEALAEAEKALNAETKRLQAAHERYERPSEAAIEELRRLPQEEIRRLRALDSP